MGVFISPITEAEQAERRKQLEEVLASIRLEGLEPSDAAKAIFERCVTGELTIDGMMAEIRALNAREYGPVRLSGQ
jgi:hypothetical protein